MKALLLVWIATCALIHANAVVPWIWGPVLDNKHVTGAHIELWREFGKTDARYLRNDNLIMSLEGMMVFVELPIAVAWFILVLTNSHLQYHAQFLLSCFQFFGTSMYFMGAYLREWTDIASDPAQFWGSFVCINGIWWLVPLALLISAASKLTVADATRIKVTVHKKKAE